jgi:hypothetical protein
LNAVRADGIQLLAARLEPRRDAERPPGGGMAVARRSVFRDPKQSASQVCAVIPVDGRWAARAAAEHRK